MKSEWSNTNSILMWVPEKKCVGVDYVIYKTIIIWLKWNLVDLMQCRREIWRDGEVEAFGRAAPAPIDLHGRKNKLPRRHVVLWLQQRIVSPSFHLLHLQLLYSSILHPPSSSTPQPISPQPSSFSCRYQPRPLPLLLAAAPRLHLHLLPMRFCHRHQMRYLRHKTERFAIGGRPNISTFHPSTSIDPRGADHWEEEVGCLPSLWDAPCFGSYLLLPYLWYPLS